MTSFAFRLESLGEEHQRALFSCGEEALDRYFQTQVTQDVRRRVASYFVAVEVATGHVPAYYTLSASSIPLDLPPEDAKRLPRYPTVPAVRIGRLCRARHNRPIEKGQAFDSFSVWILILRSEGGGLE